MRRTFYGVPSKSAPQRKTPCAEPPKSGERRGFPKPHDFLFHQLETKSVNRLPQRGKTPSAAGVRRFSLQTQAFRSIFFTRNARRSICASLFSRKSKNHAFCFFPLRRKSGARERGECENFDNKRALKHFRRGEKRRQPQARGGCPFNLKRIAASLLRDSREASNLFCARQNHVFA